jgi:cobalt/nickel transport protein
MQYAIRPLWALAALCLSVVPARAHYNMLLPEKHSVQRGEAVTFLYQWGHPFEHQLFDAPAPREVWQLSPGGTRLSVLGRLQKQVHPGPVKFFVRFQAEERGDYLFGLVSAPIWMEEEQEFVEDFVKTVVHVQAQRGWDATLGMELELVPLTRPYGLAAGCAFLTQGFRAGKPLANALVEVERYSDQAPSSMPPDEQITRTVKTDVNGVATCTLAEPGWWCITLQHLEGTRQHDGKPAPVRKRASFWVYVDSPSYADKSKNLSQTP